MKSTTTQNFGLLLGMLLCFWISSCQREIAPVAPDVVMSPEFRIQKANTTFSLISQLKGINYYPQNTPWEKFWPEYDAAVIDRDLDKIRELGFNTVRVFVFYEQFGGENVKPEMKAKLEAFLSQTQQKSLKVVVTLFDHSQRYHPRHLGAARRHVEHITQGLENHEAIAAWDIKNESDLDYAQHGAKRVKFWLSQMQRHLRARVNQPITASYARAENMGPEVTTLDYLTFHYYEDERQFASTVQNLRQRFPAQPVVLGEFGYHTWEENPLDPHPEAHQYNYYQAILGTAQELELHGIMVWSLYDHPVIENSLVLGTESHQQHMGLFDLQGQPKSGALALQQAAHVLDAQTGTAVTLDTRQLKLVVTAKAPTAVHFHIQQQKQVLKSFTFEAAAGANVYALELSASEVRQLLHLEDQLQIQPAGQQAESLILRQD